MSRQLGMRVSSVTRLFTQVTAQSAQGPQPSGWGEHLSRTPSVHRQSSRWRPPASHRSAYDNVPPHTHAGAAEYLRARSRGSGSGGGRSRVGGIDMGAGVDAARNAAHDARHRLLLSYHDLERALERRGLKGARVLLAVAAATAIGLGLAWPRIKQWGAVEGAEVAAASLEHEQLQAKAVAMLHDVLTDPGTGTQVERVLKLAVQNLFKDVEFTDWAVDWTAQVFSDALLRDNVVQRGTEYVGVVLAHEDSMTSAEQFLSDAVKRLVADEAVQDTVASGIWSGIRASMMGRRRPRHAQAAVEHDVPKPDAATGAAVNAAATGALADTSLSDPSKSSNNATPKSASKSIGGDSINEAEKDSLSLKSNEEHAKPTVTAQGSDGARVSAPGR